MTVALIVLAVILVAATAYYAIRQVWTPSTPSPPTARPPGAKALHFSFITTVAGTPFIVGGDGTVTGPVGVGNNGFKIEQTVTNPEAYCLLSGSKVRDCTCVTHRSVK